MSEHRGRTRAKTVIQVMSWAGALAVLGWVVAGLVGDAGAMQTAGKNPLVDSLRFGMTPKEVKKLLGEPAYVSRQILHRRHIETWIYDQAYLEFVEFEYVRGNEPRLLNVHPNPAKIKP